MVQYKASSDWSFLKDIPDVCSVQHASFEGKKMAARILSRLNWVSRRFYAATASPKMTLAEKEAAESKHAECKSNKLLM